MYIEGNAPEISYLSPDTGPATGGITVEVHGNGFMTEGTTQILFGESPATDVQVLGSGYGNLYITCTLPARAPGHDRGDGDKPRWRQWNQGCGLYLPWRNTPHYGNNRGNNPSNMVWIRSCGALRK